MWETLRRVPLGRALQRTFIVFFATILVACFGYSTISTPTAHAAPTTATWNGSTLSYNNHQYSGPTTVTAGDGTGLADGVKYYLYMPTANGSTQAAPQSYIIYFNSGTDPPTATSAQLAEVDVNNGKISRVANPQTISVTPLASAAAGTTNTNATPQSNSVDDAGGTTSCSIEGIGWIVCPVSTFLANAMDYLYGIISDFLKVRPLQTTSDNAIYRGWSVARNFANICFVIGFLIIIYGQITGGMMSNYTIKKLLPRIIVAAILVNISYWICAIGVDISNILGYSVQDVFTNIRKTLVGSETMNLNWANMTEGVITGSLAGIGITVAGGAALVATGGSVTAAIFLLLPAIVGVILSALVAIIVLAMRQALITILVIIAPLAFVAYLLPNTEKWFERWRDLFMNMLMLFPIFSVIFGGSQLAGSAIIAGSGGNVTIVILGMVVQVAPLVITPIIVRFSGSLLGRIAGMMNNPNKGLIDRTRNWANPRAEMYKQRNLARANTGIHRYGAGRAARRMYRGEKTREARTEAYKKEADNRVHEFQPYANPNNSNFGAVNRYRAARNAAYGRNGYEAAVDRGKDADLRHKELEAHHERHYYAEAVDATTETGRRRRSMLENAHVDEGVTKLHQDSVNNAGELALRQTISNSGGLQAEVITSVQNQKQASEFETIVQKAAEASYDNYSRTNEAAQELRLRSTIASDAASNAERQMNLTIEEARAQGYQSQSVADANTLLADELQSLSVRGTIQDSAIDSAKRVTQQNVADVLKSNPNSQIEAAGVGGDAAIARVIANAKSTVSSALLQDINNIEDTLDYDLAKSPKRLRGEFDSTNDMAKKIAVARAMSKNGGPGMTELRQLFDDYGSNPNVTSDDLDLFKEVLGSEGSIRSAGKDMEFFLSKASYQDRNGNLTDRNGNLLPPGSTPIYKTFDEIKNEPGTWTNLSATAFAGQSAPTQHFALKFLHDNYPDRYMSVINNIRSSPPALGSVKQGVIERFSIYSEQQRSADPTLPAPGTVI